MVASIASEPMLQHDRKEPGAIDLDQARKPNPSFLVTPEATGGAW